MASLLPECDPIAARGGAIGLYLGNGASMCAIQYGRSIASTVGFTAVAGLPMGTRSGCLDPRVIFDLMDQHDMDTRDVENLPYRQSGLLEVSGISSDTRTLISREYPGPTRHGALLLLNPLRARFSGGGAERIGCHSFHSRVAV